MRDKDYIGFARRFFSLARILQSASLIEAVKECLKRAKADPEAIGTTAEQLESLAREYSLAASARAEDYARDLAAKGVRGTLEELLEQLEVAETDDSEGT